MTDSNYTHCVLVVDRSGSMESVRKAAQKGINDFRASQIAEDGKVTFTLTQFDTEIETVFRMRKGKKYVLEPRGGTALFDAVGQEIIATGRDLEALPEEKRPGRVVFLVVTDGQENSSQEFTLEQVRDMIAHQRDVYSWQFQFIGAGDSAWQGHSLGVASTRYDADNDGVTLMYAEMTRSVSAYRSAPVWEARLEMAEDLSREG